MLRLRNLLVLVVPALALMPLPASAAALTIVNVNSPAINCVFNVSCTVGVTDSPGPFTPPGDLGNGNLQSRTYPGKAPAPAAGDMAYVYRIDLTAVKPLTADNCVTAMSLNFGSVVKLPYSPKGLFQVFVVTTGGMGSVGLSSAIQTGAAIKFTFTAPVCPGATSFFFGLASKTTVPVASKATVFYSLGGSAPVAARVP